MISRCTGRVSGLGWLAWAGLTVVDGCIKKEKGRRNSENIVQNSAESRHGSASYDLPPGGDPDGDGSGHRKPYGELIR